MDEALAWCAAHQEEKGYWNDFVGTVGDYKSNDKVDAWDSSGAMFLLVASRYRRAGGKPTQEVVLAAQKALKCIQAVTDGDGLTWATPVNKVKYLMDNVEVYAGLRAGADFFKAVHANLDATNATAQADLIAQTLPNYWNPSEKHFAYAMHPNGKFEGGLLKPYPHGLAQLFGIAFISAKAESFAAVQRFPIDNGPVAPAGTEWWVVAASRLEDAKLWRLKLLEAIATFSIEKVYLYRPGIAALGLLEGADWMPSIAGGD